MTDATIPPANTTDSTINDSASQAAAIVTEGGDTNAAAKGDISADGDNSTGDAGTVAKATADAQGATTGTTDVLDTNSDPAASAAALMDSTSPAALSAGAGAVDPAAGLNLQQVVTLVTTLAAGAANVLVPGASLLGLSITQIANLAVGVEGAIPDAVAAFEEIKAMATNGSVPTADQVATWAAAADQANTDLVASAEKVIAAG